MIGQMDIDELNRLNHENAKLKRYVWQQYEKYKSELTSIQQQNAELEQSLRRQQAKSTEQRQKLSGRIADLESKIGNISSSANYFTSPSRSFSLSKRREARYAELEVIGKHLTEITDRVLRECSKPFISVYSQMQSPPTVALPPEFIDFAITKIPPSPQSLSTSAPPAEEPTPREEPSTDNGLPISPILSPRNIENEIPKPKDEASPRQIQPEVHEVEDKKVSEPMEEFAHPPPNKNIQRQPASIPPISIPEKINPEKPPQQAEVTLKKTAALEPKPKKVEEAVERTVTTIDNSGTAIRPLEAQFSAQEIGSDTLNNLGISKSNQGKALSNESTSKLSSTAPIQAALSGGKAKEKPPKIEEKSPKKEEKPPKKEENPPEKKEEGFEEFPEFGDIDIEIDAPNDGGGAKKDDSRW